MASTDAIQCSSVTGEVLGETIRMTGGLTVGRDTTGLDGVVYTLRLRGAFSPNELPIPILIVKEE